MFYQIFLSPQVKGSTIISNKHVIQELSNDLRTRILENLEKNLKMTLNYSLVPILILKMKVL